jgi:hypothetical protein
MKNIDKLINLYFYICEDYNTELYLHCQRLSNNYQPKFTDEEVLTIYFYCLIVEKRYEHKDIYDFADNYLRSWFPNLGKSYESFLTRLNKLNGVFVPLIFRILRELKQTADSELLYYAMQLINVVDSMPIVVAQRGRSYSAKVAPELCDRGYCASKKMTYYGLKLHVLGFARQGRLPVPEWIGISPASNNDLTVFKPIFEQLFNRAIYADKIYKNQAFQEWLLINNNTEILTPVKLKKGQKELPLADKLFSKLVSKVRQPIEGFFAWIIEKTQIQKASKVRSENGLITHVFGRLAAAIMIMTFDFL